MFFSRSGGLVFANLVFLVLSGTNTHVFYICILYLHYISMCVFVLCMGECVCMYFFKKDLMGQRSLQDRAG